MTGYVGDICWGLDMGWSLSSTAFVIIVMIVL